MQNHGLMKASRLARGSAVLCLTVLLFAGCAGQPVSPIDAPLSGRSWIASEAKAQDLLYVSDVQTNDVYVYSSLSRRLVGTLTGFGKPRSECSDLSGNVWIADVGGYDVAEYAHGGAAPIIALSTPGAPEGCSVSPVTGDLAVTANAYGLILAVFHHGSRGRWRDPKTYSDPAMHVSLFCGYDAQGNLFLDGLDKHKALRLDELAHGSTTLTNIAVRQTINTPGQVQWDGKYIAIGDAGLSPSRIYQFSISGTSAKKVGATTLDGSSSLRQSWIQGTYVIAPDLNKAVGFWNYPAGGSPTKILGRVHGYGATVSPATQSPPP